MGKPIIIGVAGGSASGKTTVVDKIVDSLGRDQVSIIQHDSYYFDRSELPPNERVGINYDHPNALETTLLVEHLAALLDGRPVNVPMYDFANHTRDTMTVAVQPRSVVIVEGILILADKTLRDLLDIKVFVDADSDLRVIRRIERDTSQRGRSLESVVLQYLDTVRPMHLEFVEPSKRFADVIIPEGGYNNVAVDMLIAKIKSVL
jgi:uridine kinase